LQNHELVILKYTFQTEFQKCRWILTRVNLSGIDESVLSGGAECVLSGGDGCVLSGGDGNDRDEWK
jgi:hypothetical protein